MILDQKKLSVETDHILLKDSNNGKVSKKRRRAPSKRKKKARRKDFHNGRWSEEEKLLFLVGLRKYGKGKWKEMASVLTSRSVAVHVVWRGLGNDHDRAVLHATAIHPGAAENGQYKLL